MAGSHHTGCLGWGVITVVVSGSLGLSKLLGLIGLLGLLGLFALSGVLGMLKLLALLGGEKERRKGRGE